MYRLTERLALAGLAMCWIGSVAAQADACPKPERQPATRSLITLLETDADLKSSLEESIRLGQQINSDPNTNPVKDLATYYDFIDALLTYNPRNMDTGTFRGKIRVGMDGANYCHWNILDLLSYSYFLVDRQITTDPRGQMQFLSAEFGDWMRNVAQAWGDYLETSASKLYVPEFTQDPYFGKWYCPPEDGYATFQEFFTRELCATEFPSGSRPVQGYSDPETVVSIGDSNSEGWWPISKDGKLVTTYDTVSQAGVAIKGKLYNDVDAFILGGADETVLEEFGSIDPSVFHNGTWTHQFLNVNNYHRLHLPVAGKIIYLKHIQAGVRLKSGWIQAQSEGEVSAYDPQDTPDWQFGQTRMVIGIQTENHGVVVISPMGMAQVSSIQKRDWVTEGAEGKKGWEFANFAFGGSDFVVMFQPEAEFVLTVPEQPEPKPGAGVSYVPSLQGEKYGCFGGKTDCSDKAETPPASPPDQAK